MPGAPTGPVMLLPGDVERVSVRIVRRPDVEVKFYIVSSDSSVAPLSSHEDWKFVGPMGQPSNTPESERVRFVNSIPFGDTQDIFVFGRKPGTCRIELRVDGPSGPLCASIEVRVGGRYRVEVDRPVLFEPSLSGQIQEDGSVSGVGGWLAEHSRRNAQHKMPQSTPRVAEANGEDGELPFTNPPIIERLPISFRSGRMGVTQAFAIEANKVKVKPSTVRVRVFDKDNGKKPGRPVAFNTLRRFTNTVLPSGYSSGLDPASRYKPRDVLSSSTGHVDFKFEADHAAVREFIESGLAFVPETEYFMSPDDPSIRTEIEVGYDRCTFLVGRAAISATLTDFLSNTNGVPPPPGITTPFDSKSKAFSAYVGWNEVTGKAAVDSFVSQRATDREFLGYGVAMTLDTSQNINHNGHELNMPTGITTPVPMMNKVTYTALERNLSNTRVIRLPDDVLMGSVSINIVTGNSAGPISDPMYPILHPAYTRLESIYHPNGATGWLNTVNVTESQEYFTKVWHAMAQDRANTAVYPEVHQFSSFGINLLSTQSAPGDFEDLVGQGTTSEPMLLTVGGLAAEFSLGFVPGYDVIDAVSYGLIKPVFDGEDDLGNYGVAAASTLGLLADAGYLAGPVGLLTNAATSSVKVCVKFVNKIGSPWLKRMLSTSDTLRGSLQDALDYMAKHLDGQPTEFAIEYVGAWTDWAVRTATSFINGSRRCAYPAYAVLKANSSNWQAATMAAYRRVSTSAIGDTATHGWAFVARRMSQLQNLGEFEIRIVKLRGSLSDTASEAQKLAADQAMKRVGDSVEATMKEAGEIGHSSTYIKSVDDAFANVAVGVSIRFRQHVTPHIGPGKAFASMEEFEFFRMKRGRHLNEDQKNAMKAIRAAIDSARGGITVGTNMRKIVPLSASDRMTLNFGSPNRFEPTVGGFVTRAEDAAGLGGRPLHNGPGSLNEAMGLDYPNSPYTDGYAVIDFDATIEIAGAARVPKSQQFMSGGNDRYLRDDEPTLASMIEPFREKPHGYPYTGNGFVASRDGVLRPEYHIDSASGANTRYDLPAGAIMSKYDESGTLLGRFRLERYDVNGILTNEWIRINP